MFTGILKFENEKSQIVEKIFSANNLYPHGSEIRMKIDGKWHAVNPSGNDEMVDFELDSEIQRQADNAKAGLIKNLILCTIRKAE